jgi:hypothetical protein
MCIWMYCTLCVQCAVFVIPAVLVILYFVIFYSLGLSTMTRKIVVDKESNLLRFPSRSKLAWRGDRRAVVS